MATLEAVVTELQELNQNFDLNLEANFEINDNISTLNSGTQELISVMNSFIQTVPAAVMQGFDALLDFEKTQAKQKKREEEVGQQKDSEREPFTLKGAFMEGFKSDPVGEMKKNVMDSIGNVLKTVGKVTAVITTLFGAITLPMIAVAGAITALVSGVMNFVEDFKAQEGSLFDKIIAGIMGFIDGVLKLITLPIDAMLWVVEKIAGVLGLETIENALSDFSVTDFVDELTDSIRDFLISVKNYISDKINAVKEGFLGFFGLGSEEEEETSTKRGMVIPSGKEGAKLSERGQAAVDALKGDGVPEVNPETGKRGMVIPGTSREVGGVVVEVNGERRTEFTEEEIKKINAARNAAITMGNPDPLPNFEANVVSSSQSTATESTPENPVTNYAGDVIGALQTGSSGEMSNDDSPSAPTKVKTALEVGGVVVRENGKMRTEFTEQEIQKINAARNAAVAMGNPDPLPNFQASVIPPQPEKVSSKLVYPVVDYEGAVIGAFNTPEEAAQFAMTNSGIVVNAMPADAVRAALTDDTSTELVRNQPPIVSALTPETTLSGEVPSVQNTAPNPSVTVANDRGAMTDVMVAEQSKLDDAKAAESKPSAPVAINAPNTNTTVSNQTINAGPMPSATDKSDRTDRRAAFRGRAI